MADKKAQTNGTADIKCDLCLNSFDTKALYDDHVKTSNYHKRMALRNEHKEKGLVVYTKVATETSNEEGELTEWLTVVDQPLIGMEYIVEVARFGSGSGQQQLPYYVCELCGMSEMAVVEHVLSRGHKVEYLLAHWLQCESLLLNKLELTEDEKAYLQAYFKDRSYPKGDQSALKSSESLVLINKCVTAIFDILGRKPVRVVKESKKSSILPRKQPPLTMQVKGGHKDDDYPASLKKKLNKNTENFSKMVKVASSPNKSASSRGRSSGGRGGGYMGAGRGLSLLGNPMMGYHQGGYGGGGGMQHGGGGMQHGGGMARGRGPAGPPARFAHQGFDFGGKQQERLTLLDWLHKTAQKMDKDPICVSEEVELGQQVMSLLRCGIQMFHNRGGTEEICHYPAYVDVNQLTLMEWLRLTVKFFDSAWLCSPREVTMAQVVISQLETEINKFRQRTYSTGYGDMVNQFGNMGMPSQDRAMNPNTGKVYYRRPGKSHYTIPVRN